MSVPRYIALSVLMLIPFFLPPPLAWCQDAVLVDVSGCGGGKSSSGGMHLHDTVGQSVLKISSEPSFTIEPGYWCIVDALHIGPTTEVMITAFEAILTDEGASLFWEIGSAVELEGFNIYRSEEESTGYTRLNDSLLPVDEGYRYIDETIRPGTTYWYRLGAVDLDGESMSATVKVDVPPMETTLYQNYPNPFNPTTTIAFYLADAQRVILTVYDIQGKRVRTLVNEKRNLGKHRIAWNGLNDRGEPVSSGVYFYRLRAGKTVITKKLTLLK